MQNKTDILDRAQTQLHRPHSKPRIHIHTTDSDFSIHETYIVISQNMEEHIAEVGRLNVS